MPIVICGSHCYKHLPVRKIVKHDWLQLIISGTNLMLFFDEILRNDKCCCYSILFYRVPQKMFRLVVRPGAKSSALFVAFEWDIFSSLTTSSFL